MSTQAWQTFFQVLTFVGALLAAGGVLGSYVFSRRIEKEQARRAAYTGEIKPHAQLILSARSEVWPKLEIGNSGAIFVFSGPQGSPLFRFGQDADLTVVREAGYVKLSLRIRDRSGKLVAELEKNEWRVNPQNSFDRNYSVDAVEVRDPSGDIVLQARALPDRVQLQVKIFDSVGNGFSLGERVDPTGKPRGGISFTHPGGPPLPLNIAPMFKYPSDRHLGQLAGP